MSSSDSESMDSVTMIMEFEEPSIELDEFSGIKNLKNIKKLPETNTNWVRKRSYSKEDVEINPKIFGSGAISPEFVISDEDEYRAKDDSEVDCRRSKIGNPNFKKSYTGPSNKTSCIIDPVEDGFVPDKGYLSPAKYTKGNCQT